MGTLSAKSFNAEAAEMPPSNAEKAKSWRGNHGKKAETRGSRAVCQARDSCLNLQCK
jgi:hypothetical protein